MGRIESRLTRVSRNRYRSVQAVASTEQKAIFRKHIALKGAVYVYSSLTEERPYRSSAYHLNKGRIYRETIERKGFYRQLVRSCYRRERARFTKEL